MTAVEYTPPGPPALIYPIDEACAALGGMSRATLYREVAAGRLQLAKIGRRSFVTADELRRYVSALGR